MIGVAAVQGLLLSVALLVSAWRGNLAHRWLGAYVLSFTLGMISEWLYATRAIRAVPHLAVVFDWLILWLGPFCYGYVRALFGMPAWSWFRLLLHLLPGLLVLGLLQPRIWQSAEVKRALLEQDFVAPAVDHPEPLLLLFALQTLCYLLAGLRLWLRHRRALEQQHSNIDALAVGWLRWLLGFNIAMWCIWQPAILFGWTWADQLNLLGFAVGVYTLGYFGIREPTQSRLADLHSPAEIPVATAEPASSKVAAVQSESVVNAPAPVAQAPRYLKSAIDPATLQDIVDRLHKLMREQLAWREPELSLSMLAQRLGVRSHELSQALNTQLGQSFFDYVNGMRVADVQAQLAAIRPPGPPLLELALAAGFSSKATFNACFKKVTGMTPSAWRESLKDPGPTG